MRKVLSIIAECYEVMRSKSMYVPTIPHDGMTILQEKRQLQEQFKIHKKSK